MLSLQYILIFLMMYLIMYHILNFEKAREVWKINIAVFIGLVIFDIVRQIRYGYQAVVWYDEVIGMILVNGVWIYSLITAKKLVGLFLVPIIYLVCVFINMVASGFVFTLLRIDLYNLYISSIHSLAGIASGALLLGFSYCMIKKLQIQLNVRMLNKGEAIFITFFLGIFGFYVSDFYAFGNERHGTLQGQIANLSALFSGIVAIYGIVYLITKKTETLLAKSSERQQLEVDREQQFHYKKMEERDLELRSFRHDVKDELIALEGLIKSREIDKSLIHILQMKGELDQIVSTTGTETGSMEVNANLLAMESNSKYGCLRANWEGIIPNNLRIRSRDLSILFSNLLKNAFESASKMSDEGYVNVEIRTASNLFWIEISNNFEDEVKKYPNGDFITSKQDKLNHGFGIKTIERIVGKYGGNVKFQIDKSEFIAIIAFDGAIYER